MFARSAFDSYATSQTIFSATTCFCNSSCTFFHLTYNLFITRSHIILSYSPFRAATFGRLQGVTHTPIHHPPDDILGHNILLQLILQHLHIDGLKASRKVLEEESRTKCTILFDPYFNWHNFNRPNYRAVNFC
jgi:hypothetical protein